MPTDLDASPDAAATSFAHPQETFDASLTRAAQRLMDLGGVSDVRVLHNGRVITGIAGDRQRVYVQYSHADATILDGECSCGELSPCVHIAAVVMSAATLASERSTDNRPRDAGTVPRPSDGAVHGRESLRQFLAYLIEPDAEGFRLSVWVAQSVAGSAGIEPGAHPFAARTADGGKNYPRYVDSRDRAILDILPSRLDSPWQFTGAHGFEVLQRLLETQRAFWRTLPVDTPPQGPAMSEGTAPPRLAARTTSEHRQSPRGTPAQHRQPPRGAPMPNRRALRAGAARPAHFAWRILANGDQCLTGEPHGDAAATPSDSGLDAGSFEWLLHVDPPVYIDTSTGLCGPLDLPYPAEVLRHYWRRATIDPAEVAAILAELADDSRATRFPRPHRLAVEPRALSSVRARLVLSAGPSVRVQFLYNDMLVASAPPQHAEQISRQFVEPDLPQAGGQPSQQLAEPLSPPPAVHDSAPPTAHASPPPAAHASPPPAAHASPPLAARASISRSGDARTEAVVRHRDGNTVHEIKRDAELERQLRAQLDECLPDTPREAGAWLTFMMHGVPALQALGWQIAVQPDFPYRIATAEEWYVDVQSHRATPANEPGMAPATARARTPHGTSDTREWFDLRLGVRVDGSLRQPLAGLGSTICKAPRVAWPSASTTRSTCSPANTSWWVWRTAAFYPYLSPAFNALPTPWWNCTISTVRTNGRRSPCPPRKPAGWRNSPAGPMRPCCAPTSRDCSGPSTHSTASRASNPWRRRRSAKSLCAGTNRRVWAGCSSCDASASAASSPTTWASARTVQTLAHLAVEKHARAACESPR